MCNSSVLASALKLAQQSEFERARLGAVLFKRGKVLGQGWNAVNKHQSLIKTKHWEGSIHAEVAAIVSGLKRYKASELKGSSLCVVRVNKTGKMLLARPCEDCMDTIANIGIREVFYSDEQAMLSSLRIN